MQLYLADDAGEPELVKEVLVGTRRAAGRMSDRELVDRIDRLLAKIEVADRDGEDEL